MVKPQGRAIAAPHFQRDQRGSQAGRLGQHVQQQPLAQPPAAPPGMSGDNADLGFVGYQPIATIANHGLVVAQDNVVGQFVAGQFVLVTAGGPGVRLDLLFNGYHRGHIGRAHGADAVSGGDGHGLPLAGDGPGRVAQIDGGKGCRVV